MPAIKVAESDGTLSFEFDDLVRFHGRRSVCGLTVGYKIMQAAWEAVWQDVPPQRDLIKVESAFPGPGTQDAFEMVTRAVSRRDYTVLQNIAPGPQIAEAAKGTYFFRLSDDRYVVELGLEPSVVPSAFVPLRRKMARGLASNDEATEFRALQFSFSDRLRAIPAKEAVNIMSIAEHSG